MDKAAIDYIFFIKNMRGYLEFIDPWSDYDKMKELISSQGGENANVLKLFCLGTPICFSEIKKEYVDNIEALIEGNILLSEKNIVRTNNFAVIVYQGLKILTEINPWYETCTNPNTDIYIGLDSLRLGENIKFERYDVVLDLCSGTGIQGLLAAKSASKVVSVEINPRAANVIEFNAKLNGLQDIIDIRVGDLYSVLEDNDLFDAIYANPPFIPMLEDITYPICGSGGKDGLDVLNKIISQLNQYLANDGVAIIFCQCLGDSNFVFFNNYLREYARNVNWKIISAIIDKIPLDYQIFQLSELTALYNTNFDRQKFAEEMKNNYKSLGATYLYSLIYKIKKSDNNSLKILMLCNDWSVEDSASTEQNISIEKDEGSYIVYKNNEKIGFFDKEAKDTYDLLNTYGSLKKVQECIKSNSTSIDITCKLLQACNMMEKMGIIKKM